MSLEKNPIISIGIVLLFAGSVFLTSDQFVDSTNAPKNYFVSAMLVIIVFTIFLKKKIFSHFLKERILSCSISIIIAIQGIIGLLQYNNILDSHNFNFPITGSFDNPAGFASLLSIGFPISLFLALKSKGYKRYLHVLAILIILLATYLSESRSGQIAILVSSLIFMTYDNFRKRKFEYVKANKIIISLAVSMLIAISLFLYHKKEDSANGRLLIWNISLQMIYDKPLIGQGLGGFQAKYMDYQAKYFKENPESEFALLADNVKHPFNEFIKIAVEFGILGLLLILSFSFFLIWKMLKVKSQYSKLSLSGLVSFGIMALFSYPLQYIAVWILLSFYLSILLPKKKIILSNSPFLMIARILLFIIGVFLLSHIFHKTSLEKKWKTTALNSLSGNTEEMMPEYKKLYASILRKNRFFLYNYGAELHVINCFNISNDILMECQKKFNDYDLQILIAKNYVEMGKIQNAIDTYTHASNMIPCRFIPIYRLFEIYKDLEQKEKATIYAQILTRKQIKISSNTINLIKSNAKKYLEDYCNK